MSAVVVPVSRRAGLVSLVIFFGLLLGTLTGHTNRVYVANFSPDGKFLLTSSADFTARIFIADLPDLLAWAKQQLPIDSGQ